MRPYGWRPMLWYDEDGGPTSKYHKLSSKKRRTLRRTLHKRERSKIKQQLEKENNYVW